MDNVVRIDRGARAGRLESLAAGVMVGLEPASCVSAAAEAGWPACGVWFDPATWSPAVEADIATRAADCGITILDIEPIIVGPGDDSTERLVAAGHAIGARFVLFTSRIDNWPLVIERFGRACDLAAQACMTVVCEFLPIYPLATLERAVEIVAAAGRTNGGVLIDNLHLRSSGRSPHDLVELDRGLLPYVQVADAPSSIPEGGFAALLEEALDGRSWPGDADLPIDDFLAAVPEVPISFEVRSKPFRTAYPSAVERAVAARRAVDGWRSA